MRYRKTMDEELALILEEGEGYTLEFKSSVNSDLSKELVAFANASGGRIFIGVNDRNQIVGCDLSNKLLSRIEDMAAACVPPVTIRIEKLPKHKIVSSMYPKVPTVPTAAIRAFICVTAPLHRK